MEDITHLQQQIDDLTNQITELSALVERQNEKLMEAVAARLEKPDPNLEDAAPPQEVKADAEQRLAPNEEELIRVDAAMQQAPPEMRRRWKQFLQQVEKRVAQGKQFAVPQAFSDVADNIEDEKAWPEPQMAHLQVDDRVHKLPAMVTEPAAIGIGIKPEPTDEVLQSEGVSYAMAETAHHFDTLMSDLETLLGHIVSKIIQLTSYVNTLENQLHHKADA